MPRRTKTGRAIVSANQRTNLPSLPERFAIGGTEIRPLQLFENPNRHPRAPGPWENEPDKLAWIDARTGKDCILLRQPAGEWAGYVGVSPAHPLWGFSHDALPTYAGIRVHGPIDYAAGCEEDEEPQISVCHVLGGPARRPHRPSRKSRSSIGDDEHSDTWWFGFTANQPGDLLPNRVRPLEAEEGRTYRDIHFMYDEVTRLAGQLDALETKPEGSSKERALIAPKPKVEGEGGDDA